MRFQYIVMKNKNRFKKTCSYRIMRGREKPSGWVEDELQIQKK